MCQLSTCPHKGPDRRGFIAGLAAVGASMALPAAASGKADAILLSCMDFRLIDELGTMMNQMQYHNSYDHVVLAGAGLGAVHPKFQPWHGIFWDHVGLAVDLHGVREIVVINHRDCGAAKMVLGEEVIADPGTELAAHSKIITDFSKVAAQKYPQLLVKGFLMGLDGTVERLRPEEAHAAAAAETAATQSTKKSEEPSGDAHATEPANH